VNFLNNEKPDFSDTSRKASANRLIDQVFIRREVVAGMYPAPAPEEVDRLLDNVRKQRFRSEEQYQQALQSYGINHSQLKDQLRWQLTVLRFVDLRFRPA